MNYNKLDPGAIRILFKQAGADDAMAAMAARGIMAALSDAGRDKSAGDQTKALEKLQTHISKAFDTYNRLDAETRIALEPAVGDALRRALFATQAHKGRWEERKKHKFFAGVIHAYAVTAGISENVTNYDLNPIVLLFEQCTGVSRITFMEYWNEFELNTK